METAIMLSRARMVQANKDRFLQAYHDNLIKAGFSEFQAGERLTRVGKNIDDLVNKIERDWRQLHEWALTP